MAHHFNHARRTRPIAHAVALLLAAATAQAQDTTTLKPVTVTGSTAAPTAGITGFGDAPLSELPIAASVIGRRELEAAGARRLADVMRFEASITDAYNAGGYWDFLTVRGFTLDNRSNYRREGLPINAETTIPLDNKDRIEILRGTSGIQAGTSAPGGLVNYRVKRPTETDLREVRLEASQSSSLLAAADLGGRFGADNRYGYRINVAQERLRPLVRHLEGERSLLAMAADWRVGDGSLLEGEFEWSRKQQASQVGLSLLGNVMPAPFDPRLNLNHQAWAQPSEFDALTGTLRYTRPLARDWRWSAQIGTQGLKSDDYTVFPFGCSTEGQFDRFCSDGTFDYYDFRSVGERRRLNAASIELTGKAVTGRLQHDVSVGVLASKARVRLPANAFNPVGIGNIQDTAVVSPDPTLNFAGVARDERSTEVWVQDAVRWSERVTTWAGLRHTRLSRDAIATDGTGATSHEQSLTTPWLAAGYRLGDHMLAYASWGRGVESQVVPNNPAIYANPGAVLPALRSRQWEIGLKGERGPWDWQLAWFDIERPLSNIDFCNRTFSACTGQFDGRAEHRGLEAQAQWSQGAWRLGGALMLLDAKRQDSTMEPATNGRRPINVPEAVARAHAAWRVPGVPGLELQGHVSHEGRRAVLADESIMLPSWTRVDAALRYQRQLGTTTTTWTVGVDNVLDRDYWRESPFQFGHVYLYPGAPRTVRVGFTAAF